MTIGATGWTHAEFGQLALGDAHLNKRKRCPASSCVKKSVALVSILFPISPSMQCTLTSTPSTPYAFMPRLADSELQHGQSAARGAVGCHRDSTFVDGLHLLRTPQKA